MADGIEYVELGSDDSSVIALKARGKITAEDMATLVDRLESVQASGRKARVYVDLTDYESSDLSVAKEKFAHMSTFWTGIERCAYVVDKGWMSTAIGLVDAVTPMHLRAFDPDQDAQARTWILE